jgi:hypothetical protein
VTLGTSDVTVTVGAPEGEGPPLLEWLVIKVDWADEGTESASVEDGVEVVEDAWADAEDDEGELLAETSEDEDEPLVGFGIVCFVSTIVMETETVVASGSATSVDFVT